MTFAYFDTECYKNYWLFKIRPEGMPTFAIEIRNGQALSDRQAELLKNLLEKYTCISFNGRNYDEPMNLAALLRYNTEALKTQTDMIISRGLKPWELNLPRGWRIRDHIDLIEVAPGAAGLKQYGARIHSKKIQDLPYPPESILTPEQMAETSLYCDNDLDLLEDLHNALKKHIRLREYFGNKYGIDLRSKSDAQMAEAIIKRRCEQMLGRKIVKPPINWNLRFQCNVPEYITFQLPQLRAALDAVRASVFTIGANGKIQMPPQLDNLDVVIGSTVYRMGLGGIHSQEKRLAVVSDADYLLRMPDVASYYPALILNSGKYPLALGEAFRTIYADIRRERLHAKGEVGRMKKAGQKSGDYWDDMNAANDGGKIMINGTFGKTSEIHSCLFAPEMFIDTTIPGQLSILMLIEWLELSNIPVVSANTDGIVIKCPRDKIALCDGLIKAWERRTGLEMETNDYRAIYAKDVNNYFAIDETGDVKRKGEYAKSGLDEKKNPDVEICSDAVAAFLSQGTPIMQTILSCRDIRKFITVIKVTGGGVKMWGEGVKKGTKVADMTERLLQHGWVKSGRKWEKGGVVASAADAYATTFAQQRPEYLGKVVRWYYGTNSPGPIVSAANGNTVSLSYGSQPVMTLPDEFPTDIDYSWYIEKAQSILFDVGFLK
jgi:hypothetical protein